MAILLIAEHDNQSLKAATLNTLGAAHQLEGEIHVLVAGAGCTAVGQAVAQLKGVTKVLLCDAPQYAERGAENLAELVRAGRGLQPCAGACQLRRQEPATPHCGPV
jgi:electron transfer flavoprotein alpha subunit